MIEEETYACSLTSRTEEERSRTKWGTAPAWMTTWVWSEVPEAMSEYQLIFLRLMKDMTYWSEPKQLRTIIISSTS